MRHVAVIIPARFGASRFPGKPLAELAGRPLIAHVVERARRARGVDVVAVATDDARIARAAEAAGATAILTGPAATGTDRVAEAARRLAPRPELIVNLQGDEPLIEPEAIETLIEAMAASGAGMGTLARPLAEGELERPQVVKVVTGVRGDALYFSRAPIPHRRDGGASRLARAHVGIWRKRRRSSSSGRSSMASGSGWPTPATAGSGSTRRRTWSGRGRSWPRPDTRAAREHSW